MCGRYSITTIFEAVRKLFDVRPGSLAVEVPPMNRILPGRGLFCRPSTRAITGAPARKWRLAPVIEARLDRCVCL
jgi:hypothetical protein